MEFISWQVDGRAVGLMCLTSDVDINVPWIQCWHNKSWWLEWKRLDFAYWCYDAKGGTSKKSSFSCFFLLARAGTNHFFFQVSCLGWYNRPLDVRKFFPWKNGLWKMIRLISWGPARWFLGEGCSKKNPKGLSSGLNSLVRRVWQTAVFFS